MSRSERVRALLQHLDALLVDFDSELAALGRFKAVAGLYARSLGPESLRAALLRARTAEEVRRALEEA